MRAFVAARFERNGQIEELCEQLRSDSGIRIVPDSQRHVTLLFFQDLEDTAVEPLCRAIKSIGEKKFSSYSKGLTGFPHPRRSRVLVLLLESPELGKIHGFVSEASPKNFDRKEFRSHITLARARRGPFDSTQYEKYGNGIEVKFTEIALMKSELTPQGPVYTELCSLQLM